jgi:hypothetical protein
VIEGKFAKWLAKVLVLKICWLQWRCFAALIDISDSFFVFFADLLSLISRGVGNDEVAFND